jgi:DNA-binding CsgD family transcriptional regulator/PAS domain-containing protein
MDFPSERTEKLLDAIYDSATENELWPHVLTEIADMTDSQGGILFGISVTRQQIYFDFNGRLDEECNRVFQERHMNNPWTTYMNVQPVGRLVSSDEILDLSALRMTALYDEVLRPQNIAYNGMMALAAREDFRAAFNVCRTERQGPFDNEDRRFLEWLSRHLHRSMILGFRLDSYRALQNAAFCALDRLADGVIVLDRRERIIFANAAARAFEAEGLLQFTPVVATYSQSHSQRLAALVKVALRGAPGGTMSIPRPSTSQLLTILVSSVRSKDIYRLAGAGMKDSAALVFVIDPARQASVPVAQIMDAYGLTHAEARVALAASSGSTVMETAQSLGLSPNTIKTHLRRVFAKTATGRQAELAGLIAAASGIRLPDTENK